MSAGRMAWAMALLCLSGCATLPARDPLQVTVAGIEPIQGEGLELRLLTRLRVQNPNDAPIDFRGVYVRIELQGKTFATGVADEHGTVPAFGETVVDVPVTASAFRIASQFLGVVNGGRPPEKFTYSMTGKLAGGTSGTQRFEATGELSLAPPPAEASTTI